MLIHPALGGLATLAALWVFVDSLNASEEGVLALMKAVTGHHWVTHGLIDLILFVVLGWALSEVNKGNGLKMSANGLIF